MGQLSPTDIQGVENLRLVFQLAHERNENLVQYTRITDGAIWGFIALAAIELFKDGIKFVSPKVPFFCILIIVSMYLWRNRVNGYQKDIIKGYNRMVKSEYELQIPYSVTIRKNLEVTIDDNPYMPNKPSDFSQLCELLTPEKYNNKYHIEADFCAFIIEVSAILILILWLYQRNPEFAVFYLVVSLLTLVVAIIFGKEILFFGKIKSLKKFKYLLHLS